MSKQGELKCEFCNTRFWRTCSRMEYKCPKCGEFDVTMTFNSREKKARKVIKKT